MDYSPFCGTLNISVTDVNQWDEGFEFGMGDFASASLLFTTDSSTTEVAQTRLEIDATLLPWYNTVFDYRGNIEASFENFPNHIKSVPFTVEFLRIYFHQLTALTEVVIWLEEDSEELEHTIAWPKAIAPNREEYQGQEISCELTISGDEDFAEDWVYQDDWR